MGRDYNRPAPPRLLHGIPLSFSPFFFSAILFCDIVGMEGIAGTYVQCTSSGARGLVRRVTVLPNGNLRVAGVYAASELGGGGADADLVGTQWTALFSRGPSATVFTTRFGVSKRHCEDTLHPEFHVQYHVGTGDLLLTPLGGCSGEAGPDAAAERWKPATLPGTGVTCAKAAEL